MAPGAPDPEPMKALHESAIDVLVRTFEKRARARRRESYGVLSVMFVLLSLAAWVFIHAKDITTKETSQNTQTLLLGLQKKRADAAAQITDITKQIPDLLRGIGEIRQPGPQRSPAKYNIELSDETGKLRNMDDVLSELKNDLARTGYNYVDYEIRIKGNPLPSFRLRVTAEHLRTISPQPPWPKLDFSEMIARLGPLVHDFDIADSAINQIFSTEKNREVEVLIGRNAEQPNSNLSLPFLVQLNITRFGTISLVAIGLGILSPLYRFSARLAAFYQARADGLRLHQEHYKETSILQIIEAFTPTFDFGKIEPPDDRLSGLLKLFGSGSKE